MLQKDKLVSWWLGRSERLRKLLINGIGVIGSRATTLLVSLISLPLTVNYLGAERFGMLETIVSLLAVINFADLGLGFGLQNRMAALQQSADGKELRRAVSSVFSTLLLISALFSGVFFLLYSRVSWAAVFNVQSATAQMEVGETVLVFFVCFVLQIPFSIVQKIQTGLQRGYVSELWRSAGNITGLLMLYLAVKNNFGVPVIVLAIYGSNTLFLLLNFGVEMLRQQFRMCPFPLVFDRKIFKELYLDGLIFLALQVGYIVLVTSDRFIITQVLGAAAVADYSIGFRLATLFATPVDAFALPLLPAFNDALAMNDIAWIKKVLRNGFRYVLLLSGALALVLVLSGNTLIRIWIGPESVLPMGLLMAFGGYILFSNLNSLISYTMLTPRFIRKILVVYLVATAVAVVVKTMLVFYFGIPGVVWGTVITMTLIYFSYSVMLLKRNFE